MSELSAYLAAEKKNFLLARKGRGGRAKGFRKHIGDKYQDDPAFFSKLVLDAFMASATKTWEQQPRRYGPDLFSVAGYPIPEFLTRPSADYVEGDDLDDETEAFEKVDAKFATVQDLLYDATIKLRKAAQSAAAAEQEMKAVDDARRLARGNMAVMLKDIADATAPLREHAPA